MRAILTIDDIPSKNTKAIVDYLCEKDIVPVMFAIGEPLEEDYEDIIYALKKGAIIGNHSYTHVDFAKVTYEQGIEEIEKTEKILDEIYKKAGVERKYKIFRFPYLIKGGDNKERFQAYLQENGFCKIQDKDITGKSYHLKQEKEDLDIICSFDCQEYNMHNEHKLQMQDVLKRMEEGENGDCILGANEKHIILIHAHDDSEAVYPEYYKAMIDFMLEKGMKFEKPEFA